MTFGLILKRMRRNWRSMAILLLAVCLLTGFFALGPFYVRAVTDVGLRFELDNASRQSKQISLIVEDEPLTLESFEVVRQELGSLAVGVRHFIRADYTAPTSEQGFEAGLATGALMYQYGEPVTFASPRIDAALQPFAFADMPELLDLVEGRWPVRLPTPEDVDPTGLSDARADRSGDHTHRGGAVRAGTRQSPGARQSPARRHWRAGGDGRGRDCRAEEPGRSVLGRQPQLPRRGRGRDRPGHDPLRLRLRDAA